MTLAELITYLQERGYRLEYLKEGYFDRVQWQWVVSTVEPDSPAAWGKDFSEQGMVDHILQMPHLHPEKPYGQRMRDFGIELGPFDPDSKE